MKNSTLILSAIMITGTLYTASAQTPVIDARQSNQQQRIQQGVNSGALTTREATTLEKRQDHIQNIENRAKADGVVTNAERARIHNAQDRTSRAIYRKKHNGRTN